MRTLRNGAAVCAAMALTACGSNDQMSGEGARRSLPAETASTTETRLPGRTAAFEVENRFTVTVPQGARELRMWAALPQQDDVAQRVSELEVESPWNWEVTTDGDGNEVLYLEAENPRAGEHAVVTRFVVERDEQRQVTDPALTRPLSEAERTELAEHLEANENVKITPEVRRLAAEIVGAERNPVLASRRIYDWVLANVDYWVKDPEHKRASPVGSSEYCLSTRTGNCTDFHSLYAALSRAAGVPTRMVYGSFLKLELDGQPRDQSYHCWIEFYAPELGWVPLDVAVADVFVGDFPTTQKNAELVRLTTADGYAGADPSKVEYYFGSLEERRVTWNRGRDLALSPAPAAGRLNALPKAHVEIDGAPVAENSGWKRMLTFRQVR